jgi:hypothetical protein
MSAPAPARPRRAARARFVQHFADEVRRRYPSCPAGEEFRIARYACGGGERVGHVAVENGYVDSAVELAVVAHVRHRCTPYEALLRAGVGREAARDRVAASVSAVLGRWSRPGVG